MSEAQPNHRTLLAAAAKGKLRIHVASVSELSDDDKGGESLRAMGQKEVEATVLRSFSKWLEGALRFDRGCAYNASKLAHKLGTLPYCAVVTAESSEADVRIVFMGNISSYDSSRLMAARPADDKFPQAYVFVDTSVRWGPRHETNIIKVAATHMWSWVPFTKTKPAKLTSDLETYFDHEAGHVFGMGHIDTPQGIMYSNPFRQTSNPWMGQEHRHLTQMDLTQWYVNLCNAAK